MKKRTKLAFSLIELSIVILVIGILVVGITQGSRIIARSSIAAARSLTISSPVNATSDLALWFETTLPESFNGDPNSQSSPQNDSSVVTWYDINPHTNVPNNAVQNTLLSQPTYKEGKINNLPVLSFDGNDDVLPIASNKVLTKYSYTIFVVEERMTSLAGAMFGASNGSSGGMTIRYNSGTTIILKHFSSGGSDWGTATVPSYSSPTLRIISATFNQGPENIYINGDLTYTSGSRLSSPINTLYEIGFDGNGAPHYNGYLAEIILFNRALKSSERHDIEAYLANKWGQKSMLQE